MWFLLLLAVSTTLTPVTSTTTTTDVSRDYRVHDAFLAWSHDHPGQVPTEADQRSIILRALGLAR